MYPNLDLEHGSVYENNEKGGEHSAKLVVMNDSYGVPWVMGRDSRYCLYPIRPASTHDLQWANDHVCK